MKTLVARYLARPTYENAVRLVQYMNKHNMAMILADHLEKGIISEASARVAAGEHKEI